MVRAYLKPTRVGGEVPVYGSNGVVGSHNEAITQGPPLLWAQRIVR